MFHLERPVVTVGEASTVSIKIKMTRWKPIPPKLLHQILLTREYLMKRLLPLTVVLISLAISLHGFSPLVAQETKAKKAKPAGKTGVELRAKRGVEAVAKGMELSEEQKTLLHESLLAKYKGNASKLNIDTPNEERKKVWVASNAVFTESMSAQFSKKELREANKLIRAENEKDRIFNGKDLEGWEQVNGIATYEVIDGEIVGTTATGSPNSFLATKKKYSNFDLSFDVFLVSNELNSGVQIRSNLHTEETLATSKNKKHPVGRVFGYQCEIEAAAEGDLDTKKYGDAGYIYDEARRGWLVDDETRHAAKTRGAFRNQKWNRIRIKADGDHIQTWINSKKICDLKDDMTASGFIALQVHGIGTREDKWQVKWRNINLRELP